MSAEATRMQDLASKFSKNFQGSHLRIPTAGGGDSLPHPPQPGLWPGAGRKRPGVGTKTLVLLNFSAVVALLVARGRISRFPIILRRRPYKTLPLRASV